MARSKRKEVKTIVVPKIKSDKKFQIEEAYKMARTNLSFSILKEGCKKIIVTSSLSKEGKSTASVNIAIALAQQINTKVLLVDCDLRRPRVNQFFDLLNTPGLTDYLSRKKKLEDVTHKTDIKNLSTICAGTIPPNPSEILSSDYFEKFLTAVESRYDYIVIDTSPLNMVVDALPLAKLVDGVVISIMQGESTHPELQKTIETLRRVEAKILGVVMHSIKVNGKKGYKYDYDYGY